MYCVNTSQVAANKRNKMVSFRASEEEIQRIKTLSAELIKSNQYLRESDILRELVGLENTLFESERPDCPDGRTLRWRKF